MKILVTGAAGFIGSNTARQLLERGDTVVGLDHFNDYYDVELKNSRAALLDDYADFRMVRLDLADRDGMEKLFRDQGFETVIHLAAQAGVRYSIEQSTANIAHPTRDHSQCPRSHLDVAWGTAGRLSRHTFLR